MHFTFHISQFPSCNKTNLKKNRLPDWFRSMEIAMSVPKLAIIPGEAHDRAESRERVTFRRIRLPATNVWGWYRPFEILPSPHPLQCIPHHLATAYLTLTAGGSATLSVSLDFRAVSTSRANECHFGPGCHARGRR